ncbi:hypothetical protein LIER_25983 [Lithospermum erythrorhizon]|uniref:AP2/ERF domain-containing protein n=1 Tax=Lithospermum erythrorhizon TaxID=34254 RepID=A0AAV3RA56_LITER
MKLRNQATKLRNNKLISNNIEENISRKRTKKSTPSESQPNISKNPKTDEVSVSGTSRNIVGVTKRKSGKYGVKIHDRIRKKDVWLGTFECKEEASNVYWAKKNELEKEFEGMAKKIHSVDKAKKTSKFVGVSRRASGKFAAHIRDPIRKKKLYLGVFASEEKASEVYLAKKVELEEEVKGKEGVHWYLGEREGRRATSLEIRKRRNFGEEIRKRRKIGEKGRSLEDDYSDTCSSEEESDMEFDDFDSSEGESGSRDVGIVESSSILEVNDDVPCSDNNHSRKEFDNNDCLNVESGPSNTRISEEISPVLEENPCLHNQESLKEETNHFDSSPKENAPVEARDSVQDLAIQKNVAEIEVLDIDSRLIVNPSPGRLSGAEILLRTNSGTPLMDSNGFLLGEWSLIDDLSLSSRM